MIVSMLRICCALILMALPTFCDDALDHARRLLKTTPLIDGHNDLPWVIRTLAKPPRNVEAFDIRDRAPYQTDLPRLRQGMVGGQFWSVYIPGEIDPNTYPAVQLEQIDIAKRIFAKYPDQFGPAFTAADIEREFRNGKIASLIGMEGGYALQNSLGSLRMFYALGVRYMTLTHNVTLNWADAALGEPKHNGLTKFGREVVREMNRLGMLVDLSHVSPKVMSDALDTSEAPVIFSHSSARELTNHKRNVPDEILRRMPKNGGVVMVTFVPAFVSQACADWEAGLGGLQKGVRSTPEREKIEKEYIRQHGPEPTATLQQVADHIEHVRKIAGADHVGIAADFAGEGPFAQGLEDVSKYPDLFAELIRRGWPDGDLRKLAGENLLRTFREAEVVAARLQKSRGPSNATIEELDGNR
jgi:membrane dipeptidase